ncbi:MAG: hypothetical protein PHI18_00770 [bacterium]|nr:hypothetical protein [bacterium]
MKNLIHFLALGTLFLTLSGFVSGETLEPLGYICGLPGEACAVTVYGNHAYIAEGLHFLSVFDISDPLNPQRVAELNPAGNHDTKGIVFQYAQSAGNFVWLGDAERDSLYRINVSDPLHPVMDEYRWPLLSTYDGIGISVKTNTDDQSAVYVACESTGLRKFRSWPLPPQECAPYENAGFNVVSFALTPNGYRVWMGGQGCFRGLDYLACVGYDLVRPLICGLPPEFRDAVMPNANEVWIAAGDSGIYKINVTNPEIPTPIRPCTPTGGFATALDWTAAFGGRLVVGNLNGPLALFDGSMNRLALIPTRGSPQDVEWKDDLVIVASFTCLEIFRWSPFDSPEELVIAVDGPDIVLTWLDDGSPVYRIYQDTNPEGTFDNYVGSTTTNSYRIEDGASSPLLFYVVKAWDGH